MERSLWPAPSCASALQCGFSQTGNHAPRAVGSPYVFSGLLQCAECGGTVTVVSGCWAKRQDVRYGCSLHYNRGRGACGNNLLLRAKSWRQNFLRASKSSGSTPMSWSTQFSAARECHHSRRSSMPEILPSCFADERASKGECIGSLTRSRSVEMLGHS